MSLISVPDKEANLHLVETIGSTTNQFKALIEKTRKFTVDIDFTVKDRAHSNSKNQKTKLKKLAHGRKALFCPKYASHSFTYGNKQCFILYARENS